MVRHTRNRKQRNVRKTKIRNSARKTRKHKQKKNKKQKGGILLKMPADDAFKVFINNSQVELLTDQSSYGIILKLTLNPGVDSPYEMFSASQYKKTVSCLLVKLVALAPPLPPKENGEEEEERVWEYKNKKFKTIDLEETFEKEVNIQTDIFFKTMEYLEPLCPAPVYSVVYKNKNEATNFLRLLETKTSTLYPTTIQILQIIRKRINSDEIPWLGVLGMEIAEGYVTLFDAYSKCITKEDKYFYEWYEQMGKLQILKLALKTGYSQNDFHRSNLLVNPDYKWNYKGLPGKVIIIDFGLASKIDLKSLQEIKDLYNQKGFQEALNVYKTFIRSDGLSISEYPDYYGWLYNEDENKYTSSLPKRKNDEYNGILAKLITKENAAIDDRIKVFDEKHNQNPDLYPLLPLSNTIKNQFYQGLQI